MKKVLAFVLSMAMVLSLAACGGSKSANSGSSGDSGSSANSADYPTPENPITLKLGHVGPPNSSLQIAAETIAEGVKEKTGGAVVIEVYPQSQLGDAIVMLDGLSNGTLEMAMVGCNEIATMLPDFYAFCMPFLFNGLDEFITVARDPEVTAKANEIMNTRGITLIGFPTGEGRGYSNTQHAVHSPADIAGQKVRIQAGSIYVDTFEALGAVPSTMAFSEVYSALQQGVIQAEDNGADMLTKMKFAEVEKYHTMLNHMVQSNPLLISNEIWNRLSNDQQNAIVEAEAAWGDNYLPFMKEQLAASVQAAKDAGVEIVELSDSEFQAFKDATASVYDAYTPQIDASFYELICGKIDAYRG